MTDDSLYEDLNPDVNEDLGAFKTSNPDHDRFHRQFIHLSPAKSKFKKNVEMVLCAHGWKNPDQKEPMTLVVLGLHFTCHATDFRFQFARIWLTFEEDDKRKSQNGGLAWPEVVEFAPFMDEERWDEQDAEIKDTKEYGGSLGASYMATAAISAKHTPEVSYTRKHFARGTACCTADDKTGRVHGVEWYHEQNHLQNYGVEPYFHVAAVVKRRLDSNGNQIPFRGIFDMHVHAGFAHDFDQGLRRMFRLKKPEDEAIYFDPSRPEPVANGRSGEGARMLEKIDLNNMGELAQPGRLTKVSERIGNVSSGLEPLQAPEL